MSTPEPLDLDELASIAKKCDHRDEAVNLAPDVLLSLIADARIGRRLRKPAEEAVAAHEAHAVKRREWVARAKAGRADFPDMTDEVDAIHRTLGRLASALEESTHGSA